MPPKDSQQLPGKEAALFRQVVKFYETKQYKKGIKAADQVLKKFPEHGETLAMKGLICNCMDKKEEAYDLVRKGLKAHLQSHVCWHVYGLLYRSDRNYDEAIKCYKNALRQDKDNMQILRDLAQLQVQMRDVAGFVDTRHTLLQLKPANRAHWIAFAIAHHLGKNYEVAVQVLDAYAATLDAVTADEAYGYSEMLLYKGIIMEEAGWHQQALDHLNKTEKQIRDRLTLLELRGRLLLAVGDLSGAEAVYRSLLAAGPDNHAVHKGLQASLGLVAPPGGSFTAQQQAALAALYEGLAAEYPHSNACRRLPLDFLEGTAFESAARCYVQRHLDKGVPALFVDLRPLFKDSDKQSVIVRIVEEAEQAAQAAPTARAQSAVWAWAFRAQYEDWRGVTGAALALVDKAIAHTPTVIELHGIRSKVLKHAGDAQGAAAAAEQSRTMDLADRYLNCIAVRRLFRAGDIDGAERTATLFTKDGDQINNLHDMQCIWYEIESGNAHFRKGQMGRALKKFLAVVTHFSDFAEDQFDFHSYCIRKMTLRSYVALLRTEDSLYGHKYFFKAACGAVRCYLRLYDAPPQASGDEDDAEMAKLSPEERRRLKQKLRKAASKQAKADAQAKEAETQKRVEQAKGPKKTADGEKKKVDLDPQGVQLAAVADPLKEATGLLTTLLQHSAHRLKVQELAFEVYMRKGRLLLALRAVKHARALAGKDNPTVHCMLVRVCKALAEVKAGGPAAGGGQDRAAQGNGTADATAPTDTRVRYHTQTPSPAVLRVMEQEVASLLDGCRDHADCNSQFTQRVALQPSSSVQARLAAASMAVLLDAGTKRTALDMLLAADLTAGTPPASHEECIQVEHALRDPTSPLCDAAAADAWRARCREVFRWSGDFDGADRVPLASLTRAAEPDNADPGTPNGRSPA